MKDYKKSIFKVSGEFIQLVYDEKTNKHYICFLDETKKDAVFLEVTEKCLSKLKDKLWGFL